MQSILAYDRDFVWRNLTPLQLVVLDIRLLFVYSRSMRPAERHSVYMYFQCRERWHCQFTEADLKTPLPKKLYFTSAKKVVELAERGGGLPDQESRVMLNQAVESGRGGVFLKLTAEQYEQLKRR